MLDNEITDHAPRTRMQRIDDWLEQARLCDRDGRQDLVDICLREAACLAFGGDVIRWDLEPTP